MQSTRIFWHDSRRHERAGSHAVYWALPKVPAHNAMTFQRYSHSAVSMDTLDNMPKMDLCLAKTRRATLAAMMMGIVSLATLTVYVGAGFVELLPHKPVLTVVQQYVILSISGLTGFAAILLGLYCLRCCSQISNANSISVDRYKSRAIGSMAVAMLGIFFAILIFAMNWATFVTLLRQGFVCNFQL